jgi:hypothetical protein
MDHAILAAIQRFPDRALAIEARADGDEEFHSLCTDLADAEAALGRWERSPSPLREERCTEYGELIRDLAIEIAGTLDRSLGR